MPDRPPGAGVHGSPDWPRTGTAPTIQDVRKWGTPQPACRRGTDPRIEGRPGLESSAARPDEARNLDGTPDQYRQRWDPTSACGLGRSSPSPRHSRPRSTCPSAASAASPKSTGSRLCRKLLHSTKHIRYSTTRGTNALVERKGPRIGLITDDIAVVQELRGTVAEHTLFDDLIGGRVTAIDTGLSDEDLAGELVRHVNKLTPMAQRAWWLLPETAPRAGSGGSCSASSRGTCSDPSRSCTPRNSGTRSSARSWAPSDRT
ncbi:hydantoinase/oxoprolinase N-terminal domain-containing protein [Rhodococcus opacus]|uniref:hydantoinase/oxoprolinase N-terminal domain-containing protein n=1 Tax=Rhodococcus opacus TaxID=37919 RepID=UPI002F96D127